MERNLNWLDRLMLAVTFAESNCPEEAKGYLAEVGTKCVCRCGAEEFSGSGQMHPVSAGTGNCH